MFRARLEVEWKWLLLADPADYHLPKASANAIPMPASRKAKDKLNAKRLEDEKPRKGDHFTDGCTWAEFNLHEVDRNRDQVKVDLAKEDQVWHYLGPTSTEAKAQYTEDPTKRRHNPKGNYLDTLPKPAKAPTTAQLTAQLKRQAHFVARPNGLTATKAPVPQIARVDKPYEYKPRTPSSSGIDSSAMFTTQMFAPPASAAPNYYNSYFNYSSNPAAYQSNNQFSMHRFEVTTPQNQTPYQSSQQGQSNWHKPTATGQSQGQGNSSQQGQAPSPGQTRPLPTASTSAPQGQARQSSKLNWQVHPSIYNKYPFFQVHHNRSVIPPLPTICVNSAKFEPGILPSIARLTLLMGGSRTATRGIYVHT